MSRASNERQKTCCRSPSAASFVPVIRALTPRNGPVRGGLGAGRSVRVVAPVRRLGGGSTGPVEGSPEDHPGGLRTPRGPDRSACACAADHRSLARGLRNRTATQQAQGPHPARVCASTLNGSIFIHPHHRTVIIPGTELGVTSDEPARSSWTFGSIVKRGAQGGRSDYEKGRFPCGQSRSVAVTGSPSPAFRAHVGPDGEWSRSIIQGVSRSQSR
jgi:hypothetical protein